MKLLDYAHMWAMTPRLLAALRFPRPEGLLKAKGRALGVGRSWPNPRPPSDDEVALIRRARQVRRPVAFAGPLLLTERQAAALKAAGCTGEAHQVADDKFVWRSSYDDVCRSVGIDPEHS